MRVPVASGDDARAGSLMARRRPLRTRWFEALAGICLWLLAFGPARASGITVAAPSGGAAGWQVEAGRVSPAAASARRPVSLPAPGPASAASTYTVQKGDTLSSIAVKLGVGQAALAARNGLTTPDQLLAGQRLTVNAPAAGADDESLSAMPALPAGSPLAYVHFWPWPPVQGQTVVVWWRTTSAVSVAVEFDGQPVPAQTAGRQGWALLPVGPLDAVRTRTLGLTAGSAPTLTLPFPVTAGVFESGDVPPDTADPILSQAQQVRAEAERMAGLWALDSPFGWTPVDRFRLPLPTDGLHTSPFGTRRIYGSSSIVTTHNGEDYATAAGTPVLAPASGVVVLAEQLFVRGNAVVIDHGHGVLTGYWHMRALSVQAGDRVAPGQPLGEVGTTGLSTGPHLHWEMQVRGVPVDPLEWLAP